MESNTYTGMSDKQLLEQVAKMPPDYKAALYLVFTRNASTLRKQYNAIFNVFNEQHYEDCLSALRDELMGKDCSWKKLKGIHKAEAFEYWLQTTARNSFLKKIKKADSKEGKAISINMGNSEDDDEPSYAPRVNVEQHYDEIELLALVMEVITTKLNERERFCITRKMQGFMLDEIAEQLRADLDAKGEDVRSSKKGVEYATIDAHYVNSHLERARKIIKSEIQKDYLIKKQKNI